MYHPYHFGGRGYSNHEIKCFNCVYIYTQYIYYGIPGSCHEGPSDTSLTYTYCPLDNFKNLQDMELQHEKAMNELSLFCYCKSIYFKDSVSSLLKVT